MDQKGENIFAYTEGHFQAKALKTDVASTDPWSSSCAFHHLLCLPVTEQSIQNPSSARRLCTSYKSDHNHF